MITHSKAPGTGLIHVRLLPPNRMVLPHLQFTYPLKLISISPSSSTTTSYQTVFILSYGGGLVSNDTIDLRIIQEPSSKLCLLTQGSTKVYKRKLATHITSQTLNVTLHENAMLLLLPDPIQPFADSAYRQLQRFYLPDNNSASLLVLDWVTEGRTACGEKWDAEIFESRNEAYCSTSSRLLLRDALVLRRPDGGELLRSRMDGMAVFATLIIRGPGFVRLAAYVKGKFATEPRIGGRERKEGEKRRDVLWTVSEVRGFVLVKVSGWVLEEVRGFLREILMEGGDVVESFGQDCFLCLK